MNAIDRLVKRHRPPRTPTGLDHETLAHLAGRFPTPFPADFLELCRRYGSGRFVGDKLGYLTILNPFDKRFVEAQNAAAELLGTHLAHVDANRDVEDAWNSSEVEFTPRRDRLLTWADFEYGFLAWETNGSADDWHTVEVFGHDTIARHDMRSTNIVWAILSGEFDSKRWRAHAFRDFADVRFVSADPSELAFGF